MKMTAAPAFEIRGKTQPCLIQNWELRSDIKYSVVISEIFIINEGIVMMAEKERKEK
jgi:hypothetical protein